MISAGWFKFTAKKGEPTIVSYLWAAARVYIFEVSTTPTFSQDSMHQNMLKTIPGTLHTFLAIRVSIAGNNP